MKKQLFFLTLATLVLLSGCQSNTNSSSSPSPSPNTTTTAQVEVTPTPSPTVSPIEQRLDVDFRNAKWGDSIETTHKYEVEIDLQESDDQLSGTATVGGYDAYVGFMFDDGLLYKGIYAFPLDYTNAGQYIPVYNTLKDMLTKIYGTPLEDTIIPLETQDLIDMAGESKALEYGYVVYRAMWQTSTTDIMIGMMAQDYDVNLLITYTDKNYEENINNSGL